MSTWEGLSPPYATIVADPPWAYDRGVSIPGRPGEELVTTTTPYSMLTVEEISALSVVVLSQPGAHLYLWTTNYYLRDAFAVAESWGFRPIVTLTWCKPPRGRDTRSRFAVTTEFVLFCQDRRPIKREVQRAGGLILSARRTAGMGRGELHSRVRGSKPTGIVYRWEADDCLPTSEDWQRLQSALPELRGLPLPNVPEPEPRNMPKVDTTWFQWRRGAHSAKPAALYDLVEQVSPGPYVELFARQPRLGWDSWGHGYEAAS